MICDDIKPRKYGRPFSLCGHYLFSNVSTLFMICGVHDHDLDFKFEGHPFIDFLNVEEKIHRSKMTMNMVLPQNFLINLKLKRLNNVTYIKKVYNVQHKQQCYNETEYVFRKFLRR